MPRPCSMDLRQRVVAACEAGERTRAQIAQQFQISEATLYEWLKRWHHTGSLAPGRHAGGTAPEIAEAGGPHWPVGIVCGRVCSREPTRRILHA